MELKEILKSQYYAALEMLKQAIVKCPESLWNDSASKNRFWHIAYHTLFCTHLYLNETEKHFIPWIKHKDQYQFMGPSPLPPHNEPQIGEAYNKNDILEYLVICQREVEKKISSIDLDADSGFHWLTFSKMELQLYNIRHIQHHTGQLFERLRTHSNIELTWVGTKSK